MKYGIVHFLTAKIEKRTSQEAKKIRDIRDGRDPKFLFCEGHKLTEDLLKSHWVPQHIYCTEKELEPARKLLAAYKKSSVPISILSPNVMEFVSDLTSPPGLITIAKWQEIRIPGSSSDPLVLIIHGLQLPQNLGGLLRTAEAAGVTEVRVTKNSAHPFGPKALRGSTGSVFRLPVKTGESLPDIIEDCRARGIKIAAASAKASISYDSFTWSAPSALLLGAEGPGLKEEEIKAVDAVIRIPMQGDVESLNVGVAGALCLFEAVRQRKSKSGRG